MPLKRLISWSVMFVIALFLFSSCAPLGIPHSGGGKPGWGPPPHAPAHGHRHKHHDGVDLVYDAGFGIYVVVGFSDLYFLDKAYYRLYGDLWEISHGVYGPWKPVSFSKLPPGLKVKAKRKGKSKKHSGQGRGKKMKSW